MLERGRAEARLRYCLSIPSAALQPFAALVVWMRARNCLGLRHAKSVRNSPDPFAVRVFGDHPDVVADFCRFTSTRRRKRWGAVLSRRPQMGLLDQVIGAVLKSATGSGQSAQSQSPQGQPAQAQYAQIAAVLTKLLASRAAAASPGSAPAPSVGQQSSSGGLDVLLRQFQQNGYGEIIKSWIGTGQNQAISPPNCVRPLARRRSMISHGRQVRLRTTCSLSFPNICRASSTS